MQIWQVLSIYYGGIWNVALCWWHDIGAKIRHFGMGFFFFFFFADFVQWYMFVGSGMESKPPLCCRKRGAFELYLCSVTVWCLKNAM